MKIAFAWVLVAGMCGAAMAQEADDKAQIDEAVAAITETLKDPQAAQFRNVSIVTKGSARIVCGEVNAKNSYGGFVGFRQFYRPVGSKLFLVKNGSSMDQMVDMICRP